MKLLDRFLYYYSVLFAVIITLGAFFSGFALDNLLAALLFLPVTLTLLYGIIRELAERKQRWNGQDSSQTVVIPPARTLGHSGAQFDFAYFFAQRHPLFLATVAVFVVTLTVSILRAGLGYLPQPELISPIPTSQLTP